MGGSQTVKTRAWVNGALLGLVVACAGGPTARAAQMRDIVVLPGNAQASFQAEVWTDRNSVVPGDAVTVHFRASEDCYVTLVDRGTSGSETVIFPNQFSQENFVRAGQEVLFPPQGGGFVFQVSGPAGTERILAYATRNPTDIARALGIGKNTGGKFVSLGKKQFRDIVVEDVRVQQSADWVTAEAAFQIGQ
jgi:hypothetical protein